MKGYFFSRHAQIISLWIFHIIVAVLTFYRVHMSLQYTLTHFCSNFMRFHVYKWIFLFFKFSYGPKSGSVYFKPFSP